MSRRERYEQTREQPAEHPPFLPVVYDDYGDHHVPRCICASGDEFDIPGCIRISPACPVHNPVRLWSLYEQGGEQ